MDELLKRITLDERVVRGKPTIRGMRISVEQILRALAAGVTEAELLADYPELELGDIRAAEAYESELRHRGGAATTEHFDDKKPSPWHSRAVSALALLAAFGSCQTWHP